MMTVSSAYLTSLMLLLTDGISTTYMENSSGLITQPWGLPVDVLSDSDVLSDVITRCFLLVRKSYNQFRMFGCRSYLTSLSTRILGLIVLKALKKSIDKALTVFLAFESRCSVTVSISDEQSW